MLSATKTTRIRRHHNQPEMGLLIRNLSGSHHLVIFKQDLYALGEGSYGNCYLAKMSDANGRERPQEEG